MGGNKSLLMFFLVLASLSAAIQIGFKVTGFHVGLPVFAIDDREF